MLGNIKKFGDGGNGVRYYGLNRYATDVSEDGSNDSQETHGFFERRLDDDAGVVKVHNVKCIDFFFG